MRKRRGKPADPAAIMAARAMATAHERARAKDPASWGIEASHLALEANTNVLQLRGARSRIAVTRRQSDAFAVLFAAGGLSEAQHRASERLVRDHLQGLGVRNIHDKDLPPGGAGCAELVTAAMIDARRRVAEVLDLSGPASARLLTALIEPIGVGEVRVWREIVRIWTGETERHSQAASVRLVVENLRLAYASIDNIGAPAAGRLLDFVRTRRHSRP